MQFTRSKMEPLQSVHLKGISMLKQVVLLVCVLMFLAAFTCKSQTRPQTRQSPQLQEFYRIVHSEVDGDQECRSAITYLEKLSLREQLNIARGIVTDPDARIAYLGVSWLIANGRLDETIPSLASIIATGRDETQLKGRMGYDWIHGDEERFLRILIKLSRFLLARLDSYHGEERARVEHFLMGGMFKESTEHFTVESAKRRVAKLEVALQKQRRL